MQPTMTPAAQYVRMSTEDQQYSILNQIAAIERYATKHCFKVTRTFTDAGRSGLEIQHRPGIKALLQDVISGTARYRAILIYDVSRWGRFQDTDEAAHYEFLCKQAGIPIHYCAEQFTNSGTMSDSLLKSLKRTMAAEYSRELSVKVYEGQLRLVGLGFRAGGTPPYGLRRLLVSGDGKKKRYLKFGEWKSITTDRIVLVPGPKKEVDNIRRIFAMYVDRLMVPRQISDALNERGETYASGREWNKLAVYRVLRNPEYAGCATWGKVTQRLHTKTIHLPRAEWRVIPGAYKAIVGESMFQKAQAILTKRCTRPRRTDEELLAKLKRVLEKHGTLNETTINRFRGGYHERTYWKRFGSLVKAYDLIGFKVSPRIRKALAHMKALRSLRSRLMVSLCNSFPDRVRAVRVPGICNKILEVDHQHRVSLYFCRPFLTLGKRTRWMFRTRSSERNNIVLLCRVDSEYERILSTHILPPIGSTVRLYRQIQEKHPWLATGKELRSVEDFCEAVVDIAERQDPIPFTSDSRAIRCSSTSVKAQRHNLR
jgi:DNA invertase Pin-like site-specific DNA recombinase